MISVPPLTRDEAERLMEAWALACATFAPMPGPVPMLVKEKLFKGFAGNEASAEAVTEKLYPILVALKSKTVPDDAAEPVVSVENVDSSGGPTGPKRYQLWLTHVDIHALGWALVAVAAIRNADVLGARDAILLSAEEDTGALKDRLAALHTQARVDDGEVD